jgi:hypothetical protein
MAATDAGRHDADDGARHAAQNQVPPDDPRIGVEAPAPEAVADDYRGRTAETFLVVGERPAERGRHAEDREESRRRPHRFDSLRRRAGGVGHVLEVAAGEAGEGVVLAAPFFEPHRRDQLRRLLQALVQLVGRDQPSGVGIRQRPEQHSVDE